MGYRITTDACSDLSPAFAEKHDILALPLEYIVDGKSYVGSIDATKDCHAFYELVRSGKMPTTSMINEETHKEFFESFLEKGEDVLHIAFSSALSGTANAAMMAAKALKEKYPNNRVIVVDSLSASVGQGLLVRYAARKKESGASFEDCAKYVEDLRLNVVHMFTVEDLKHLYRGGRVSKLAAVFGTMLEIMPVLHVDNLGRLINIAKVRKRRKSLDALVDAMVKKIVGFEDKNVEVLIGHGDDLEGAKYVADEVKKKTGLTNIEISYIGPIIGAHSGPGTIALFFVGNPR